MGGPSQWRLTRIWWRRLYVLLGPGKSPPISFYVASRHCVLEEMNYIHPTEPTPSNREGTLAWGTTTKDGCLSGLIQGTCSGGPVSELGHYQGIILSVYDDTSEGKRRMR